MTNADAYPKVIDMLMEGKVDLRKVAVEFAKHSPAAFLTVVDFLESEGKTKAVDGDANGRMTKREILALCSVGKKIEAIKAVRTQVGWGLKEAKDYVDSIQNNIAAPIIPHGYTDPFPVDSFTPVMSSSVSTKTLGQLLKEKLTEIGAMPKNSADAPKTADDEEWDFK